MVAYLIFGNNRFFHRFEICNNVNRSCRAYVGIISYQAKNFFDFVPQTGCVKVVGMPCDLTKSKLCIRCKKAGYKFLKTRVKMKNACSPAIVIRIRTVSMTLFGYSCIFKAAFSDAGLYQLTVIIKRQSKASDLSSE